MDSRGSTPSAPGSTRSYRLAMSRPPVDWIDVITPFHRVALAAEAQARLGDRVFGQREASAALSAAPNLVELLIELTFHPLNTFVGVPAYDVTLQRGQDKPIKPRSPSIDIRDSVRERMTNAPAPPNPNAAPILGSGQPMLGGTMVVQFADRTRSTRTDATTSSSPTAAKRLLRTGWTSGRMR